MPRSEKTVYLWSNSSIQSQKVEEISVWETVATIIIGYVPQDWFELGLKIPASTFALCILY